jgi:hypothetical protein
VIVGGLSVIGVALVNIGVPKDSALKYEKEQPLVALTAAL